jgi:hypothetical protein
MNVRLLLARKLLGHHTDPLLAIQGAGPTSLKAKVAVAFYLVPWVAAAVVLWIKWFDLPFGLRVVLALVEVFLAPDLFESIQMFRSQSPSKVHSGQSQ